MRAAQFVSGVQCVLTVATDKVPQEYQASRVKILKEVRDGKLKIRNLREWGGNVKVKELLVNRMLVVLEKDSFDQLNKWEKEQFDDDWMDTWMDPWRLKKRALDQMKQITHGKEQKEVYRAYTS